MPILPNVVTLDESGVREAAGALAARMAEQGYVPSHLIAIADGGIPVAERLADALKMPQGFAVIKCQRPTTAGKRKLNAGLLLRRLPYFITNPLRQIESLIASRPHRKSQGRREVVEIVPLQAGSGPRRVVVVDDAVDSGASFMAIREYLKARLPSVDQIRFAAVTVTGEAPLMEPDFHLYRRQLVRFPWSLDFRG